MDVDRQGGAGSESLVADVPLVAESRVAGVPIVTESRVAGVAIVAGTGSRIPVRATNPTTHP